MSGALCVEDLSVTFALPELDVQAVDGVSAVFPGGHVTGLIGESGCGKSVLGMAALGLLPPYARVSGRLTLDGVPLTAKTSRALLGKRIGLIPQNPADSLNPARTVSAHLHEALLPLKLNRTERGQRAERLLRSFGFPDPGRILKAYPHELSGGMQQRVLCAVGAACSPDWIIADEPTKGLDRDLREQVRETLRSLKKHGVDSMLVITHDLPLARGLCDVLAVMYAGQIVEMGPQVLSEPLHPYTRAFLNALPENGFCPLPGVAPRAGERLPGCPFATRCPHAVQQCSETRPPAVTRENGGMVRCFRYV